LTGNFFARQSEQQPWKKTAGPVEQEYKPREFATPVRRIVPQGMTSVVLRPNLDSQGLKSQQPTAALFARGQLQTPLVSVSAEKVARRIGTPMFEGEERGSHGVATTRHTKGT